MKVNLTREELQRLVAQHLFGCSRTVNGDREIGFSWLIRHDGEKRTSEVVSVEIEDKGPAPKSATKPIIMKHLAGKPEGDTQSCTRCGKVITDNRGAMVEVGADGPGFWAEGPVYENGNCWSAGPSRNENFPDCAKGGSA